MMLLQGKVCCHHSQGILSSANIHPTCLGANSIQLSC
jgi:hypothetical protein